MMGAYLASTVLYWLWMAVKKTKQSGRLSCYYRTDAIQRQLYCAGLFAAAAINQRV